MKQIGYITVEECLGIKDFYGLPILIVEEFSNIELLIIENTEAYFVLKFVCDDFEEVQEVVATCAHILTGEGICKFSITINCDED